MTPELRELLELSAKAMGYEPLEPRANFVTEYLLCQHENHQLEWHPHTSWHQCFDMECALEIHVSWYTHDKDDMYVASNDGAFIEFLEQFADHDNDRTKARMMASLKVAAEIGRRMQG